MKINIVGDVQLSRIVNGSLNIDKSELLILNLEGPITDALIPIEKTGCVVKTRAEYFETLFGDFDNILVSLANNHFGDFGEKGIADTLEWLESRAIQYVGNGDNYTKNIQFDDRNIGVINLCDSEWGTDLDLENGSSHYNLVRLISASQRLEKISDYIILILHDGIEYSAIPTPEMYDISHAASLVGIDMILWQHNHIFGYQQKINETLVVYGTGSLLMTHTNKAYDSIIVQIDVLTKEVEYHRMRFDQNLTYLGLIDLDYLKMNRQELALYWARGFEDRGLKYLMLLMGFGNRFIRLMAILRLDRIMFSGFHKRRVKNVVRSRVHNEIIRNLKI